MRNVLGLVIPKEPLQVDTRSATTDTLGQALVNLLFGNFIDRKNTYVASCHCLVHFDASFSHRVLVRVFTLACLLRSRAHNAHRCNPSAGSLVFRPRDSSFSHLYFSSFLFKPVSCDLHAQVCSLCSALVPFVHSIV